MATIISHTTPHHPRVTIVEAKDTIPSSSSSSSLTSETLSQSSLSVSPLKSPMKDPIPPFTQSRVLKHVSLPRSKLREITPHSPSSLSLQQKTQPPRVNPEPAQDTHLFVDTNSLVPLKYSLRPGVLSNARKDKKDMKKGRLELTSPGKTQESKGPVMLKGSGSEEGRSTVKMASMSILKRGVSVENDNMEQSTDTDDNGDSVTTASSSFKVSFPLPLPPSMEPIITTDNELKEVNEGGGGGEGERIFTKNQWTTTEGLHYLPTKAVDDDRLIKAIQKGQELLHEIRMAHSQLPYSAMERQTDCFSIEKSEITQRVTKVLYTSSNDFKVKDTGTANRQSAFHHQKRSKLAKDSQKNKVCLCIGEADHNSASSLERYMSLTTGCPSSSIDSVPVKPVLVSSYQTTGKIAYLNDDVTSLEREKIKKEQRELLRVMKSGEQKRVVEKTEGHESSTQSRFKLDMCHIGGVTLVESKLNDEETQEEVLIEERERRQRGREEETRYEEVKKESDVCPVEEIKGNLVMGAMSPTHKLPEGGLQKARPRLAVQVLPSVSVDPITEKKKKSNNNAVLSLACNTESTPSDTEKPFIPTTPDQAIKLEGKVSPSLSPQTHLPPPLSVLSSNEAQRTGRTHFSDDVSLHQVQQKAESCIRGQAQEWAKHELLVQLLSSLRDSNVSLTSSSLSDSPQQSVAREADSLTNLVKEILLQEALSLYHPLEDSETKEEEEEEEEGESYSDTSFESEVITPLSTPSPTPPSSPIIIPKEASPTVHTPQLTPVTSLTILPKEEEDEFSTPQGSPNSESSMSYDNSTASHKSTTSCTYEVLADTSYATPTPTVISLPNDTKEKEIIMEEEKPGAPESVTDSSSFSSSSSQSNNRHSKVLATSDSSITTDNDISVGENVRSLLGAVPRQPPTVCNDVSLSEGEVPLSPGDTRWNVFVDNGVQKTTNLSTVCGVTDQYTDSMTTTEGTNKEPITPLQLNILTPGFSIQPSLLSFHPPPPPPSHAAAAFISTPFNNNKQSYKGGTRKEDIKSTNDNAIISGDSNNNNDDDTLAYVPSLSDGTHSLNNQQSPSPLSPGEVPCPHSKNKEATGSPQLSEGEVPVFTHKKSKKTREGTVVINLSRNKKGDNSSNDGAQVVRVAPIKKSTSLATPPQPQWVSQSVLRSSSESSLPRKPYDRNADPDPVFNISSRGPVMILDTDDDHNASSIDSLTLT